MIYSIEKSLSVEQFSRYEFTRLREKNLKIQQR